MPAAFQFFIAFAAFLFIKFGGADVVQRPPGEKRGRGRRLFGRGKADPTAV